MRGALELRSIEETVEFRLPYHAQIITLLLSGQMDGIDEFGFWLHLFVLFCLLLEPV